MNRSPLVQINPDLCNGCGKCVQVCPTETLSLIDKKACVTGGQSLQCGQCVAVCPESAIRLPDILPTTLRSDGACEETLELLTLMQRRRSCRNFKETPVPSTWLEDLVAVGTTAPSGTNAQKWRFVLIPDRESMDVYTDHISRFYRQLNRTAQKPLMRFAAKLFMQDALNRYYRLYYARVEKALTEWEEQGIDKLFHGATAAILVSTQEDAISPVEDALLATQNILLAAETMGLGTCLIGMAVSAMQRDPTIGRAVGLPADETVYAVIAIGYPKIEYLRPSGRKPPIIRYFRKSPVSSSSNRDPSADRFGKIVGQS